VYTNALSLCSTSCKIIKYADDTVVIGLINDNNEDEYRQTINYVTNWCTNNYLDLNASKTKEIIFDRRKNQNTKIPVTIDNTQVAIVPSYKYLGVIIQEDLKWHEHVKAQAKKANQRMYFVRRLRKLKVDSKIICLFYNSVVSSVLVYAIPSWYDACGTVLQGTISNFHHKTCKLTVDSVHASIEMPHRVCRQICVSLITKFVNDKDHALHNYIHILPHGNLRTEKCKTAIPQDLPSCCNQTFQFEIIYHQI